MRKSILKLITIIFIYLYLSTSLSCGRNYEKDDKYIKYSFPYILHPLKSTYSLGDTISITVGIPKNITDKCKLNNNIKSTDIHIFSKTIIYIYLNTDDILSNNNVITQDDEIYNIKFHLILKKENMPNYSNYIKNTDIRLKIFIPENSNSCNQEIILNQ